ncbi:flagellar basal body L-ring protein FlgH [Novipirellula artificiosorum]|uniref:Flagellar L-ring protein n=1 Tax=Novipirellula artificiosorum TaxID=2528016 RepID=A0A5C6DEV0_9BACT|nr:flagellar basal body L-ring protein FlgH [Novipirellula artificiosorum]TWU34464.1 Flagellar L-ring protein precursor [Novipirellula artificiosorum]
MSELKSILLLLCAALLAMPIAAAQDSSLLRQPLPQHTGPAYSGSAYSAPGQTATMQPLQSSNDAYTPQPPSRSMTQGNPGAPPTMLSGVSWTYQPPPQLRRFQKNDIIAIRIDEITRMMAEGSADSRKRTMYEAIVSDWIQLEDFSLRPDPQEGGDPSVATESNNQFRSESSVESRESLSFNIAATIVDIRPNGNLVLEARKTIRVNDNLWETSMSGICRAEDIAPDNTVLSRDVIDLEIRKEDQGHLRDGYKRGWFSRWFDRVQPF